MLLSALAYGLAVPAGLTVLWWFCGFLLPADRFRTALVLPSLAVVIAYVGVVGTPVTPTIQALSGLFYAVVLLLVDGLTVDGRIARHSFLRVSSRACLLLLTVGIFYYPRYRVSDKPLVELLTGVTIAGVAFLVWMVMDETGEDTPRTGLFGGGVYFVALGVFLGVYASFILGQIVLAAGVSLLSILVVDCLVPESLGGNPYVFVFVFSVALLVYAAYFTSVGPVTILLLASGLMGLLVPGLIGTDAPVQLSMAVVLVGMLIPVGFAAGYEEYSSDTGEEGSYRPYR